MPGFEAFSRNFEKDANLVNLSREVKRSTSRKPNIRSGIYRIFRNRLSNYNRLGRYDKIAYRGLGGKRNGN